MELVVFLVSLFGFLALGIPIAIVLVLCSMVLMYYGGMWDSMFVMIIPQSMLDGANNYPLMAIPFFVFAGEIMTEGGLSKRVVKLAQLIIGRVRGGLGYAAIVSSVIFAGLMGSSVGEAAALGSLLLPMMAQAGYKPGRAGGVIASGAILGPIIPPSTNFILLGATVGLSITKLFMIGLVPGLIIGLCLMVTWFFIVRIDGYKEKIEFKKGEASKIVRDAMPAFMMPVLLLGGIRFGVFTPTEGGAFACVYAIAVCTLYYRELTFKGLLAVSARAARTTSVVMLIVATATAVGWFITSAQIPMQVAELFQPLVDSPDFRAGVLSPDPAGGHRSVLLRAAVHPEPRHRRHHAARGHGALCGLRHREHQDRQSGAEHGSLSYRGNAGAVPASVLPLAVHRTHEVPHEVAPGNQVTKGRACGPALFCTWVRGAEERGRPCGGSSCRAEGGSCFWGWRAGRWLSGMAA